MSNQIATVRQHLEHDGVYKRIEEMLGKKAQGFVTSVVNAVGNNNLLMKADPLSIRNAALVAATLDLPIDPNLGFAYIVPYGNKAQFQMGYKGFVQLAIRTNQYKKINVTEVYEDELDYYDPFTGEVVLTNRSNWKMRYSNDGKVVGYYAYFRLTNGYEQNYYKTIEEVREHGKKYSKSFSKGPWSTDFDSMAKKTVIKLMLSKWGVLSIEMQRAVESDQAVIKDDGTPHYEDNPDTRPLDDGDDPLKNAIEVGATELEGTPFD